MSRYSMRVETLRGAERRSGYSPHVPPRKVRSWTLRDVCGLVFLFLLGLFFVVGGWTVAVGIAALGVCLIVLTALGLTILYLRDRVLEAPAPETWSGPHGPATRIRREPVAFQMGLAVIVNFIGLTTLWMVLAARDSPPLALVLALPALWATVGGLLVARGRFDAGSIWFTPDHLVYPSRGLWSSIGWDDILAADGDAVPAMVVLYGRDDASFIHSNVPKLWRSERMASPTMAVIRTDDMSVDPGTLTRFIGRYALTPAARSELGTAASLDALEAVRLTTSSGPLPNAFTRRRPEGSGA